MTEIDEASPNAAQITYWNATVGPTWVAMQDLLDLQLGELGLKAIEALGPREGERIVDIGCGCGWTTLELASRVGPTGAVLGADISAPMLALARRRSAELGLNWVNFVEADAQIYEFEPADAVFSRFGVMFFADPVAAFANIRRALRPGGRLAFICWRAAAQSDWMSIPHGAVAPLLPPSAPPPPHAPGPFAFADRDRLHSILAQAGFRSIAIEAHDEAIGAGDLDGAVKIALVAGPVGAAVRENPHLRGPIAEAVRAVLAPCISAKGVKLGSATWIVTAS